MLRECSSALFTSRATSKLPVLGEVASIGYASLRILTTPAVPDCVKSARQLLSLFHLDISNLLVLATLHSSVDTL